MKFFSKLKKAKGAAEEHKKAASVQETKSKVPYKHIPTHAAQDAMASAPTTIGSEDLRARIAEARKNVVVPPPTLGRSRSMQHLRSYSASSSRASSSSSAHTSPGHSRASSFGGRSNSDLSIGSVLESQNALPRDYQSSQRDYFSQPYKPTVSSPSAYRPRGYPTNSARSSMKAKRRSPLVTVSINEEDESEPSSGETPASDRSVASSQSSATEISRPSSTIEEAPYVLDKTIPLSQPAQDEKYDSAVEVESTPKPRTLRRSASLWSMFKR